MSEDARKVAAGYFDSWKTKDFATLRTLLADDVDFAGPLATLKGADDCVKGIRGMSQITTDIAVQKVFVDGADVLTWFELHTTEAPPIPVANWMHVEDDLITGIRVAFDARPLTK